MITYKKIVQSEREPDKNCYWYDTTNNSFKRHTSTGWTPLIQVADDVYSKSEVDALLDYKAEKEDTYTKSEVDEKVSNSNGKYIIELPSNSRYPIFFTNTLEKPKVTFTIQLDSTAKGNGSSIDYPACHYHTASIGMSYIYIKIMDASPLKVGSIIYSQPLTLEYKGGIFNIRGDYTEDFCVKFRVDEVDYANNVIKIVALNGLTGDGELLRTYIIPSFNNYIKFYMVSDNVVFYECNHNYDFFRIPENEKTIYAYMRDNEDYFRFIEYQSLNLIEPVGGYYGTLICKINTDLVSGVRFKRATDAN